MRRGQLAPEPSERKELEREDERVEHANGSLSREALLNFLNEIQEEPSWRKAADTCVDYYDGHQLTSEQLMQMEALGIPPIIINLIQPTVNAVLGLEVQTRSDWKVTFEDDASEKVAAALNVKLKEFEREAKVDRAISQAYAGQVKAGLGWVEVNRERNPFRYKYRCTYHHRRKLWWDWRDADSELPTARYIVRKEWYDKDHLVQVFPQMRDLIESSLSGWGMVEPMMLHTLGSTGLANAYEAERAFTLDEGEWRQTERNRGMLFEVWYRVWKRGFIATMPNGRKVEVDVKNPRMAMAILGGAVKPELTVYPQMRFSLWMGPHRMFDVPTPLPHHNFPYTPFWGYREDLTGAPYGLIRSMLSPQDEINARRQKLILALSSRRLQMDSDALDKSANTFEDVVDEISRHDGAIVLNPERRNKDSGFKLLENRDIASQQFETLAESKREIQEVGGIYAALMGQNSNAASGEAMKTLIQQGTTTLADINDEHRNGRELVGRAGMELIKADLTGETDVPVGEGRQKRIVTLNKRVQDPKLGIEVMENSVASSAVKVVLEEVPSTPTYRQAMFSQLAEITKSLPPQVQQFVIDFVIEATDHPKRHEVASRIRRALGMPEPGMEDEQQEDPAVAQVKQEAEAKIQELTQQLQEALAEMQKLQVAQKSKEAEVQVKAAAAESKSELDRAHADKARADIELNRMAAENDRLTALAALHKAEDPKGEQTAIPEDAMEGAIEELLTTMREGFREMHGRMETLEKARPTP